MPATRPTGPNPTASTSGEQPVSAHDSSDNQDLPAAENDRLLAAAAKYLRDRRLAPVAVLWLESFRPLTFLGSQALHAATPLIDVFYPRLPLVRLATLLEDRGSLDRFLDYLVESDDVAAVTRRQGALDEPGETA